MAELKRTSHWERYAPNIGNNLELRPQDRLYVELAVGLTVLELAEFHAALGVLQTTLVLAESPPPSPGDALPTVNDFLERQFRPAAELLAKKWEPCVRLVGQHSIGGRPVRTLADYLVQVLTQSGIYNILELLDRGDYLNSVRGTKELFFDALSGGSSSTGEQSSAPADTEKGGP